MSAWSARLNKLIDKATALEPVKLYPELDEERFRLQKSFHEFVKASWPTLEGNKPFITGWHIQAICEHLEAVTRGEIKKLLISIPPRMSKTTIISIMWPAWVWIEHTYMKFLFSSYAQKISWEHSRQCRLLIESYWYRARWGHIVKLSSDQATKGHFTNTAMGHRIATSVNAGGTALGGDLLVMDDPNEAGESAVTRESTTDWASRVWPSRSNPGGLDVNVLVQQRTNEMDVSGFLLSRDDNKEWLQLVLPMEFETSRRARTIILPSTNGKAWEDPRTQEGELICPEYFDAKKVAQRKLELGLYNYASQYQQRPAPEEGGMIKRPWFQIWNKENLPEVSYIIQSWDTALSERETSAYSACTTWGIFKDEYNVPNLLLLTAWRGRVNYPDLLKRAIRLKQNYLDIEDHALEADYRREPDRIVVEEKASGGPLVSDLVRKGINAIGWNPDRHGDKIQRVHLASPYIECGRVWVVAEMGVDRLLADHEMLVYACTLFPNSESRDLVDTITQGILYLVEIGKLKHVMSPRFEQQYILEENKVRTG